MADRKDRPVFEEDKTEGSESKGHGFLMPTGTIKKNHPTCLLPPISLESALGRHEDIPKLPTSSTPDRKSKSSCSGGPKKESLYMRCLKSTQRKGKSSSKEIENDITGYLDRHLDFLESYIIDSISVSQLEKWLNMKRTHALRRIPSLSMHSSKMQSITSTKKKIFMNFINKLQGNTKEHFVILELARLLGMSVEVAAYRVYKLFLDHPSFVQYFAPESTSSDGISTIRIVRAEPDKVKYVLSVAKNGSCLRLSRYNHSKFPKISTSLAAGFGIREEDANHVIYIPIITAIGKTAYVIEMWRLRHNFDEKDEEIISNFVVWGSLILHYCNVYLDKRRERDMSDFLLDVVKAIFEEMVSLDQLIKRILEFAQRLVNADRASLFLVDYSSNELVSTVFDLKFEPGYGSDMGKKEIRMPINRGIAGHVALSGESVNIPDAYSDYRFNSEVDEMTGYKTMSILCMPVKVQGKVTGVVQMVNKRNNNNFDHEDEVAFEIFATFFGLALHHARLYDKILRKEQKYKVALEILSYHNTCKEHEVEELLKDKSEITININDFYLDPYKLDDFQKCKAVLTMFDDLFDITKFDYETVIRFILSVKKNYRNVPYHNFDHGWSVANAMYVILKNDNNKRFDYKMRLALFVACLCHDLDHRGYTNKYMNETASPLAAMYTTSPLEHHHFNITVTILQQDGHNIFSHLSSEEYKDILRYIRHCILATDLAVFFPNLSKLQEIYEPSHDTNHIKFNWGNPGHRDLAMAISMTAADLSASAKPWAVQIKTVKVIFEEFYDQGDKERAAGKNPIPMMDRNKPEEQPASQMGFISQICVPCYRILYKVLPETKPMYLMALMNLKNWKLKLAITADAEKNDENPNENKLDVMYKSELDEVILDDTEFKNEIEEARRAEEDKHVEDTSCEIEPKSNSINSESASREEDNIVTSKAISKVNEKDL